MGGDFHRLKMKKPPETGGLFHDSPCGPSTCHQALAKLVTQAACDASRIFSRRQRIRTKTESEL